MVEILKAAAHAGVRGSAKGECGWFEGLLRQQQAVVPLGLTGLANKSPGNGQSGFLL